MSSSIVSSGGAESAAPARTASQEREERTCSFAGLRLGAPDGRAGSEAGGDLDLVGSPGLEAGHEQGARPHVGSVASPKAALAKRTTASPSIAVPTRPLPSIASIRRAGFASRSPISRTWRRRLPSRVPRETPPIRQPPGTTAGGSRARGDRSRPRTSSTSSAGTGRRAAGRPPVGRAASSGPVPQPPLARRLASRTRIPARRARSPRARAAGGSARGAGPGRPRTSPARRRGRRSRRSRRSPRRPGPPRGARSRRGGARPCGTRDRSRGRGRARRARSARAGGRPRA